MGSCQCTSAETHVAEPPQVQKAASTAEELEERAFALCQALDDSRKQQEGVIPMSEALEDACRRDAVRLFNEALDKRFNSANRSAVRNPQEALSGIVVYDACIVADLLHLSRLHRALREVPEAAARAADAWNVVQAGAHPIPHHNRSGHQELRFTHAQLEQRVALAVELFLNAAYQLRRDQATRAAHPPVAPDAADSSTASAVLQRVNDAAGQVKFAVTEAQAVLHIVEGYENASSTLRPPLLHVVSRGTLLLTHAFVSPTPSESGDLDREVLAHVQHCKSARRLQRWWRRVVWKVTAKPFPASNPEVTFSPARSPGPLTLVVYPYPAGSPDTLSAASPVDVHNPLAPPSKSPRRHSSLRLLRSGKGFGTDDDSGEDEGMLYDVHSPYLGEGGSVFSHLAALPTEFQSPSAPQQWQRSDEDGAADTDVAAAEGVFPSMQQQQQQQQPSGLDTNEKDLNTTNAIL